MKKRNLNKAKLFFAVCVTMILSSTLTYGAEGVNEAKKRELKQGFAEPKLVTLLKDGKYLEVVKHAEKLLSTLVEGTKQHDEVLYCLGGSYYYLGQAWKAAPVLGKHIKLYGKGTKTPSEYVMAVQYWDGSNDTYLPKWKSAATKLAIFSMEYPDAKMNPFFALAKYDLANCHTNLDGDAMSIRLLTEICVYHENCPAIDRVYALRGNNYQNTEEFEKAHADYKEALKLARQKKNDAVAEEVLNYLVLLLGDDFQREGGKKVANFKLAVQYYDQFWSMYSKGDYNAQVAVTGIPALRSVGRSKEALKNLRQVIMERAGAQNAPGLEKAINSYTEEYLKEKGNTLIDLEKHYANDFNLKPKMVYARSLVKMSLLARYLDAIMSYPGKIPNTEEEKWQLRINEVLAELSRYDLSKLNNYTLVMIGDHLRRLSETRTVFYSPTIFYEQVIVNAKQQKDLSYKNEAIFGLAAILLETKDVAKLKKAYVMLGEIKDDVKSDKSLKEKAHFHMVKVAFALKDLKDAILLGGSFKATYRTSTYKVKVRQMLADAYFKSGDMEKAQKEYESILISYRGIIKYSGPAVLKVMSICVAKGREKDALALGRSYVKMCRRSFEKAIKDGEMSAKEADLWDAVQKEVRKLE